MERAKFYANRAYELVCEAKGRDSADAKSMLKCVENPEQYLLEYRPANQHYIATMTNC